MTSGDCLYLGYDEKVGHLVVVHQVLVQEPRQGGDEV